MFILGDEGVHKARFPWVTLSLIIINILVFVAQLLLGQAFTNGFSVVPYEISHFKDLVGTEKVQIKQVVGMNPHPKKPKEYQYQYHTHTFKVRHYHGPFPIFLTLFTAIFLHGDLLHLLGNMWFLGIFGRNVEHALDHGRFLLFYVVCGIIGSAAFVVTDPNSMLPAMGASGAISGVMGAYVAIYPLNKIKVWLGIPFGVLEIPALIVVGIWFLFQYMAVWYLHETGDGTDGTGYWAHIGGFLAGLGIIWGLILFLRWQESLVPQPTAEEEAASLQKEPAPPPVDPFQNFMPPTSRSSQPADPFVDRLD